MAAKDKRYKKGLCSGKQVLVDPQTSSQYACWSLFQRRFPSKGCAYSTFEYWSMYNVVQPDIEFCVSKWENLAENWVTLWWDQRIYKNYAIEVSEGFPKIKSLLPVSFTIEVAMTHPFCYLEPTIWYSFELLLSDREVFRQGRELMGGTN